MSITYKGIINGDAKIDGEGNITAIRKMLYYFNEGESPVAIMAQSEIPLRGSAHPDNASLPLATINISEPQQGDEAKSGRYEVTLNYERKQNGGSYTSAEAYPWSLPPYDISYSPVEYVVSFQRAYDFTVPDVRGAPSIPVVNSALDPFDISTTRQNMVLRFSYNLQDFSPSAIIDYMDTVNNEDVTVLDLSIPQYHGRIRSLSASKQQQFTSSGSLRCNYWVITVEIEMSSETWTQKLVQLGLYFKSSSSSKKEKIYKRVDGETGVNFGIKGDCGTDPQWCDMPQRLKADGDLLDPTGSDSSIEDVVVSFNDKWICSWSPLNFPGTAIPEDTSIFTYPSGVADLGAP